MIRPTHILKNVSDHNYFPSEATRLLSGAALCAGMTKCFREQSCNAKASANAVALAGLAVAVPKGELAKIRRIFRRLIDDASNVAVDMGFVPLTATHTP
jgi:hypothetical protein